MASLTISNDTLAPSEQTGWWQSVCRQTLRGAAAIDGAAIARVVLFFGVCAVYFMFFG